MAGKGTEVGRSFEEIAQIIDGVTHNDAYQFVLIRATLMMPDITSKKISMVY